MSNWEYKCVHAPHTRTKDGNIGGERAKPVPQIESIMDALGQLNWELVAVIDASSFANERGVVLFFKRPKP